MKELPNGPPALDVRAPIELLRPSPWQMSYGERAALEGLLSQRKPALAIEIGTAEGGSLERIALHSGEVHSFDLVEPNNASRALPNVTFHTGDSHALLPVVLDELAAADRVVDLVLVDGDHSSEGVRRDLEDLLNSPAISATLIVIHDTMNEVVRAGLDEVEFEAWPKVAYVELDFVPGYMFRERSLLGELWGGLGLVVTLAGPQQERRRARQARYFDAHQIFARGRARTLRELNTSRRIAAMGIEPEDGAADFVSDEAELEHLKAERARLLTAQDQLLAQLDEERARHAEFLHVWAATMNSFSWRITRPLRDWKSRLRRLIG
jgi:hypothetical protein